MGSVLVLFLAAPVAAAEPDARALYRLHCGGCHGQALEGGLAEPLIKSDWRFGRDGFSVESNIRHGIPGTDMPGYLGELSDEEMSALVELIYSLQTEPDDRRIGGQMTDDQGALRSGALGLWGIVFLVVGSAAPLTSMMGAVPPARRRGLRTPGPLHRRINGRGVGSRDVNRGRT